MKNILFFISLLLTYVGGAQNVGIGTTNPGAKLEVLGKIMTTDFMMTNGAVVNYLLQSDGSGNASWVDPTSVTTSTDLDWGINGNEIYNLNSGNVGIGTSSPINKLQISGSVRIGEVIAASSPSVPFPDYGDYLRFSGGPVGTTYNSDNSDNIWMARYNMASDDTELRLNVGDGSDANDAFAFGNTSLGYNIFRAHANGKVSLGTSSPTGLFHVENTLSSYSAYINNNYVTSGTRYGIYNTVQATGTGSAAAYGIRNVNYVSSTATSANYGIRNELSSNGSGTRYGVYNYVSLTNHSGSGTIYGAYTNIVNGASSTGTVYGHRINNSSTGSGNDYGLYVSGEDYNYFSGNVGIGISSPTAELQVDQGTMLITNSGPASSYQSVISLESDDYRGSGIFFKSNSSGSYNPWYAGRPYASPGFSIGYDATQAEYLANSKLYISTNGNVGIGLTNPSYHLHVSGRIKTDGITESSDLRLKQKVNDLENSLELIKQLRGVSYYWKKDVINKKGLKKTKQIGLIAQELEKILPEVVDTDNDGYKSIQYSHVVPLLIEAIKELSSDNSSLRSELEAQKTRLTEIDEIFKSYIREQESTSDK